MNKKDIIIVGIVILLISTIISSILIVTRNKPFELSSNNKYIITTDMRWMTMQDDGGSNTNQYYEIDLDKKEVRKCEDRYIGFKGFDYKNKTIYKKQLNDSIINQLKEEIEKIIEKQNTEKDTYNFYTLESKDINIKIENEETISSLKRVLKNIDNL